MVAKELGVTPKQLEAGLIVGEIGNSYSANSLLALAAILDVAKPNQKILVTSYGSGAGSDAFVLTTKDSIVEKQVLAKSVRRYISEKIYVGIDEG